MRTQIVDICSFDVYSGAMRYTNDYIQVKADISPEERDDARRLAKSKGMTFQGWMGQIIKRELASSKEAKNV